ncbi:unnamed protein product [Ectocarpus fasciculatus]
MCLETNSTDGQQFFTCTIVRTPFEFACGSGVKTKLAEAEAVRGLVRRTSPTGAQEQTTNRQRTRMWMTQILMRQRHRWSPNNGLECDVPGFRIQQPHMGVA